MRFHNIGDVRQDNHGLDLARTKEFVGDGTPILRAPGLVKVERLLVGSMEIPLTVREKYPVNAQLTDHEKIDEPFIVIANDTDECPVILRSTRSNDGMWQKDARIFVQAEWDEDAAAKFAPVEGEGMIPENDERGKAMSTQPPYRGPLRQGR